MQRFILTRFTHTLVAVWALTVIIFGLARISGDPAALMAGENDYTGKMYASIRRELKLDRPLHVQYWVFITKAAKGDFGRSWRWGEPALALVLGRLSETAKLAAVAMAFSMAVAIPVGVMTAVKRGTWLDRVGKIVALLGQSMPTFWVGIMLILVFAVNFRLLPTSGGGGIQYIVLPGVTLGWYAMAATMRLTRSSMLDVLDSEYVKMLRAKGAPEWIVVWRHGFKNALIPVVTFVAIQFASFLGGAVVTETVFAWPGVGRLAIEAVFNRDFPTVQAAVIVTGVIFLSVNFITDMLYGYIDPRIRYR